MRFLVNENVTGTVIQELRQRGRDVLSAKESMRSEADDAIHAFAHVTAKTDLESVHQLGASAQRPRWRR